MRYKAARHQDNLAACTLCETCVPTFDEVELRHWVQAALACGAEIAAPGLDSERDPVPEDEDKDDDDEGDDGDYNCDGDEDMDERVHVKANL